MRHPFYDSLEEKITAWACSEEDIRAVIVVGSRARLEHPADAWSDLDVILFNRKPEQYLQRLDWIEGFAPVWLTVTQRTVAGEPERLVVFEGGWQTDFVFQDSAVLQMVPQILASGNIPDTIRRGVRVLVDKDGCLAQVPPPSPVPPPPPPTSEQLAGLYERFWFDAIYAAKQLCRGELTRYKTCEEGLRWHLLPMMEWHARATHDGNRDTWHAGRFLADWVDPDVYAAFVKSYTVLEASASLDCLRTLASLFQRLCEETAAALGLSYPAEKTPHLWKYLQQLKV